MLKSMHILAIMYDHIKRIYKSLGEYPLPPTVQQDHKYKQRPA